MIQSHIEVFITNRGLESNLRFSSSGEGSSVLHQENKDLYCTLSVSSLLKKITVRLLWISQIWHFIPHSEAVLIWESLLMNPIEQRHIWFNGVEVQLVMFTFNDFNFYAAFLSITDSISFASKMQFLISKLILNEILTWNPL